jgi:cell division protein FtsB
MATRAEIETENAELKEKVKALEAEILTLKQEKQKFLLNRRLAS